MTLVKKILEDALALPQEEREELMSALSESLDLVRVSPAWEAELARRVSRIESGEACVLDASAHAAALRAKFTKG